MSTVYKVHCIVGDEIICGVQYTPIKAGKDIYATRTLENVSCGNCNNILHKTHFFQYSVKQVGERWKKKKAKRLQCLGKDIVRIIVLD